jgi:DNA repair exonuclease SbcCD ATPase subunit
MPANVESVAEDLYALPQAEFTAARDARSAAAKRDGDRVLADAIKKLARPTTAAWLANLLVRERTQQVEELLELGEAMREAQADLAADQMRQLATQRRQIVSALGREAAKLASDQGQRVSRSIREEMEGTLEAALADPAAGEALRSGRLTTSLRYTGLGPVDVDGAVAMSSKSMASTKQRTAKSAARSTRKDEADAAAEAERQRLERIEAAEQRLRDARTTAADAKADATSKDRTVKEVQERVDGLRRQLDELEQQMKRLQSEERFATKNLRDAERAKKAAHDASRRANERAKDAAARVDALRR